MRILYEIELQEDHQGLEAERLASEGPTTRFVLPKRGAIVASLRVQPKEQVFE